MSKSSRRDSQTSNLSREWYWSEDRVSLASSSISGNRTVSSTGDVADDSIDNAAIENGKK